MPRTRELKFHYEGEYRTREEIARMLGVAPSTFVHRVKKYNGDVQMAIKASIVEAETQFTTMLGKFLMQPTQIVALKRHWKLRVEQGEIKILIREWRDMLKILTTDQIADLAKKFDILEADLIKKLKLLVKEQEPETTEPTESTPKKKRVESVEEIKPDERLATMFDYGINGTNRTNETEEHDK